MSVRSAQSITVLFTTRRFDTGAATNGDSTPAGTLYVNGAADAASVTVTNITTGVYKAAVTLPTLAAGDVVDLRINATVNSVSDNAVVWRDTKDLALDSSYRPGIDWANVGSPTTALALTGTTIATTQKVDVETIKTQAVTCAAGVTVSVNVGTTQPVNFTGAGSSALVKGDAVDMAGSAAPVPLLGKLQMAPGTGIVLHAIGFGDDEIQATARDAAGNVYVAGYTSNDSGSVYQAIIAKYRRDGSVDNSFGTAGRTVIPAVGDSGYDALYAIAIQSDGKVVAAGEANFSDNQYFLAVRLSGDGSLDTSFGAGGIATVTTGDGGTASSLVIQGDGKVVLGGRLTVDQNLFGLARFTAAGVLDTTFGTAGLTTTAIGTSASVRSLGLQSDGKIIAGGWAIVSSAYVFAVARYTTAGVLDTTFGASGVRTTAFDTTAVMNSLAVKSDDSIVAGGYKGTVFALARYTSGGALDTSFGTSGTTTTAIGTDARINGLGIQTTGKIVAAGYAVTTQTSLALARYSAGGILDTTFGTSGVTTTSPGTEARGFGLALQPNDQIIAGGYAKVGGNNGFAVACYSKDGVLNSDTFALLSMSTGHGSGASTVDGVSAAGLATLFTVDSTKVFADAVTGSPVKEIAGHATVTGGMPANFAALLISGTGHISNVDTLTTYTGNTPQTGDAYARIGAAGAGLTALGDTRVAHLDADVSSRMATYVQPTGFLAATFPGTVASTTNITAGTITTVTTVTNLTNAPTAGDFTAAMKASLNASTPASVQNITAQTGDAYARLGAAGSGLTSLAPASTALSTVNWTSGRAAALDNLDTTVSSRSTVAGVAAQVTTDHGAGSYARNTEPDNAGIAAIAAVLAAGVAVTAAGLDGVLVAGIPLPLAIKYVASVLAGKVSGAGTALEQFKDFSGAAAVDVVADGSGNRTAVTLH